jgi:hypothetical protein
MELNELISISEMKLVNLNNLVQNFTLIGDFDNLIRAQLDVQEQENLLCQLRCLLSNKTDYPDGIDLTLKENREAIIFDIARKDINNIKANLLIFSDNEQYYINVLNDRYNKVDEDLSTLDIEFGG